MISFVTMSSDFTSLTSALHLKKFYKNIYLHCISINKKRAWHYARHRVGIQEGVAMMTNRSQLLWVCVTQWAFNSCFLATGSLVPYPEQSVELTGWLLWKSINSRIPSTAGFKFKLQISTPVSVSGHIQPSLFINWLSCEAEETSLPWHTAH